MPAQSTFTNNVHVRLATLADAPIVYTFLCELEEMVIDRSSFDIIFGQNLVNPSVHYLVAEQGGEVVGFVSCHVQSLLHHVGTVGEIQELFVRSDVRNQRIGHQLMDALTAIAIREGFVNLEVTTNQKRTDTLRFYEREFFKQTHVKLVKSIQP